MLFFKADLPRLVRCVIELFLYFMRKSSALVMASNENSAIDVVFVAESIGNVRIPCFQRGSTLKFQKNF